MSTAAAPITWTALVAIEPRLGDLAYQVVRSAIPTTHPEYGRCYLELVDQVASLCEPLGDDTFGVARDRLHKAITDAALREASW